jgi:hypothetical protein
MLSGIMRIVHARSSQAAADWPGRADAQARTSAVVSRTTVSSGSWPARSWIVALLTAAAVVAPSRAAHAQPYGINAHVPSPEVLDPIAGAGIGWVRIDFLWSWAEPQQGVFDWGRYDTLVDQALSRGLRIYADIGSTPAWATDGAAGTGPPRSATDWYDFCYRAASRYRGRIEYWGMWNEPNLARFWTGSRSQYVAVILAYGSQAVHAADPHARVCGPELAHLQSADWDSWLEDVLKQGGAYLDVVTHHVYPDGADAGSVVRALTEGSQYPWEPPSVRHVLDDTGWLGRPFWLTETGYEAAFGDANGEALQASFVNNLLLFLLSPYRTVTWVDKVFIYEISDSLFALLGPRPELAPRPAYDSYRSFITATQVDDSDVIEAEVPARLLPSGSATVTITVANRGTTVWSSRAGYRLKGSGDASIFGFPAEGVAPSSPVAPGEQTTFSFTIVAPSSGNPTVPYQVAWRMVGAGGDAFGEDVRRPVTVSTQVSPTVSYLPSLANADGLNGTHWRSDVTLYNASLNTAAVDLALLEQGSDNSFPRVAHLTVPGRTGMMVPNALGTLFGWQGTAALRVSVSGGDLRASARTYTLRAEGTSGQYISATPAAAAALPGATLQLIGLARSADTSAGFRTNLGLVNPSAFAITVDVDLFSDGSHERGALRYDLPPFGFLQVTDIFLAVGASEVSGGRAVVSTDTSGGAVLAYASRVDNTSGDPSFLAPAEPLEETSLIAAAAHNPGLNDSVWRTDVDLFNPGDTAVTCRLAFVPSGVPLGEGTASRSVSVPPGGARALVDVVGALFGAEGSGAISVTPAGGPIMVASRTYDLGPAGTFGQLVPVAVLGDAAGLGDEVQLAQLRGSTSPAMGFRSNVGLLNLSPTPIKLVVAVYGNPQSAAGQLTVDLAPYEWRQLNDISSLVKQPVLDGFARVRTTTQGARFLAYASVIDNVTGDPSFVPGW